MAKDEILEKKSVEGHFECIVRDRHGEVIERFSQHNLIPLTAYKQFLSIIAGDKKSSLSKFILGTDGVKANGEPKGEDEGFNLAIQDIFSIRNSKPHYITTWSKGDNTAQNITNIDTSSINSSSTNEETEQPRVELYFDSSSSRVYFKYHLPLSCGNLTDNTRTTAYSEAGLYIDNKLFAMKTFKALTKSYNKTMDIIWSFKTVGDSADGIEFRVDTSKLNSDIFTLPMKPNVHPLVIEWGDGTEETVIEAGLGNKALDNYKHKYDARGEFSIRILTQGIPNFDFTDLDESIKHSLVSIDSVTSPFQDNSFNSMFEGCINLRSIPYSLFRYNTNATSFNSTFKGCENLAGVPNNLFISNSNITSATSTFEGCSKAYIPLSIFPKAFIDLFKEDLTLIENLWLGTIPSLEFTIKVDTSIFTLPFDKELGIPAAMVINYGENGSYKYYDIQSEDLNYVYSDDKIGRKIKISVYTLALPKFKFVKGINANSLVEIGRTKEPFISADFKDLSGMFKDCINLEKVNIDLFSRNPQLNNVSSIFENCYKLKYASFIENKSIKDFTRAWYNCYSMTIDKNILNPKCVQEDTKFGYMCYRDKIDVAEAGIAPMIWTENFIGSDEDELAFGGAGNLGLENYESIPDLMKHTFMAIKVDIHKLDIDLKLNYNRLVSWGDHTSSRGGRHIYNKLGEYIIKIYGVQTIEEWNSLGSDLPHIVKEILNIGDIQLPTTHTFEGFYKLTKVPEQIFIKLIQDTTSFEYAFAGCESLTSVPDFTGVTDKLTNINRMFDGCMKLQAIPNGLLDAPGIETMEFCFRDCDSLTEITGQLQSTKLKSVQGMFYECSNITSIPANFFGNTINTITNYASIFFRCKQLIIPEGLLAGFENTPMTNINIDNMFNLSRVFEGSQIEGGSIAPEVLWSGGFDKFSSYESVFSPSQIWRNEAEIPENLMFGEIDFDTYFIDYNPFKAAFEQDGSEAQLTSDQIKAITGKMAKQKLQLGYTGQLNSNLFNLHGFNFKAWGDYFSNKEYPNGGDILVNYVDSTKVFKLGAIWQRALKRILFNINGGTVASGRDSEFTAEVNVGVGLLFTFYPSDLFTKQWYDLVDWNTSNDGNGESYTPGREYTIEDDSNLDLYAIWQQWEKTLVFNANNENVLNAMQNQTRVVGTEVQMPLNEFVVPRGYIFRSWNTSSDGTGTEYQENQTTTFDNKDELNLYAIWDESVDITFESNGGSGSQEKQTIRKNTEFIIPTTTTFIAPEGKTFNGFTLKDTITDVTVNSGRITAIKDIILVANWSN